MVIADIDREGAAQAAAALADSGQDVEAMAVDIANVGWVAAFADEIRSHAGRVDILNNNAAATGPAHQAGDGNVMTLDLATWDDTMAVDLTGSMLMCRGLIPLMLPRGARSSTRHRTRGCGGTWASLRTPRPRPGSSS